MYMRLTQLAIVILATILVSQPVFAQEGESKCKIDGLMDELMDKSGDLLNSYMLKASLDHKNYCRQEKDRRMIDISFYKKLNIQIEKILHRHSCTWEDIPKFRRVETVWDVCSDDDSIPLVPLVTPKAKKPVVVKSPPKESPVVVKPPPSDKKVEPKTVVRITPPLKKPALTIIKPPPTESNGLTWTVAGVAGGLSIVSIVVGSYFGVAANNAVDNADSATDQQDVDRYNQLAKDHALRANTFWIVGGLLAAGTATWLVFNLVDWDSSPNNPPTTVELGIAPGGAILTAKF